MNGTVKARLAKLEAAATPQVSPAEAERVCLRFMAALSRRVEGARRQTVPLAALSTIDTLAAWVAGVEGATVELSRRLRAMEPGDPLGCFLARMAP